MNSTCNKRGKPTKRGHEWVVKGLDNPYWVLLGTVGKILACSLQMGLEVSKEIVMGVIN